jgi:hypothetical protein
VPRPRRPTVDLDGDSSAVEVTKGVGIVDVHVDSAARIDGDRGRNDERLVVDGEPDPSGMAVAEQL